MHLLIKKILSLSLAITLTPIQSGVLAMYGHYLAPVSSLPLTSATVQRDDKPGLTRILNQVRQADVASLIYRAHEAVSAVKGRELTARQIRRLAGGNNPFIFTGTIIKPTGHKHGRERTFTIQSQLSQFVAPQENIRHPERLRAMAEELDAFEARARQASGEPVAGVGWLAMGGSSTASFMAAEMGLAHGLVPVATTDPEAIDPVLERLGHVRPSGFDGDLDEWRNLLRYRVFPRVRWFLMSMGMTSEEPLVLIAVLIRMMREVGVPEPAIRASIRGITLEGSSVDQAMRRGGMEGNLGQLQPDGENTAPGRGSAPATTAILFSAFHMLNPDMTLEEWNRRANINPETIAQYQELGAKLYYYASVEGKNRATLIVPPGFAPTQDWTAQLGNESGGEAGKIVKGVPHIPYEAHQVDFIVHEPLIAERYGSGLGSDRVFVVVEVDGEPLTGHQEEQIRILRKQHHQIVTLRVPSRRDVAGYLQGWHYTIGTMLGFLIKRNFNTQPSVEKYKATAKEMITEAMINASVVVDGAPLTAARLEADPSLFFIALSDWMVGDDPLGSIQHTHAFRQTFATAKHITTAGGEIEVTYDQSFETDLQAILGDHGLQLEKASADDIACAMIELSQQSHDRYRHHPAIELAVGSNMRYGISARQLRRAMEDIAEGLRWKYRVPVKVHEIPSENHSQHELIINQPEGVTVILAPRKRGAPRIGFMRPDYIDAQVVATYAALKAAGRKVILVTYPENSEHGRISLRRFGQAILRPLGAPVPPPAAAKSRPVFIAPTKRDRPVALFDPMAGLRRDLMGRYGSQAYAMAIRVTNEQISDASFVDGQGRSDRRLAPPPLQLLDVIKRYFNIHSDREARLILDRLVLEGGPQARRVADAIAEETADQLARTVRHSGLPVENLRHVLVVVSAPVQEDHQHVGRIRGTRRVLGRGLTAPASIELREPATFIPGFDSYPLAQEVRRRLRNKLGLNELNLGLDVRLMNNTEAVHFGETGPGGSAPEDQSHPQNVWTIRMGRGANFFATQAGQPFDQARIVEGARRLYGRIDSRQDGGIGWVWDPNIDRDPASWFTFEDWAGGEALLRRIREDGYRLETGWGSVDDLVIAASPANPNAEARRKAVRWIIEFGQEVGRALSAVWEDYIRPDPHTHPRFIPDRILLTSGVGENFARELQVTEDMESVFSPDGDGEDAIGYFWPGEDDLWLAAFKNGLYDTLTRRYGVNERIARDMANALIRSDDHVGRELSAARIGLAEAARGFQPAQPGTGVIVARPDYPAVLPPVVAAAYASSPAKPDRRQQLFWPGARPETGVRPNATTATTFDFHSAGQSI